MCPIFCSATRSRSNAWSASISGDWAFQFHEALGEAFAELGEAFAELGDARIARCDGARDASVRRRLRVTSETARCLAEREVRAERAREEEERRVERLACGSGIAERKLRFSERGARRDACRERIAAAIARPSATPFLVLLISALASRGRVVVVLAPCRGPRARAPVVSARSRWGGRRCGGTNRRDRVRGAGGGSERIEETKVTSPMQREPLFFVRGGHSRSPKHVVPFHCDPGGHATTTESLLRAWSSRTRFSSSGPHAGGSRSRFHPERGCGRSGGGSGGRFEVVALRERLRVLPVRAVTRDAAEDREGRQDEEGEGTRTHDLEATLCSGSAQAAEPRTPGETKRARARERDAA